MPVISRKVIQILKEEIDVGSDYIELDRLKFLKDNPRVYACTHAEPNFDTLTTDEQQHIIFEKLRQEPSVKKLRPDIKQHGGLIEPILIRWDTMEVIEGNSRLAVYKILRDSGAGEDWDLIPCEIVQKLTDEQQAAFLNQIHVKGKTNWSAYEKANFAYVRRESRWSESRIAELFGESIGTIRTRLKVIRLMKESEDSDQSHFSRYDVSVRVSTISKAMNSDKEFREFLLSEIKQQKSEDAPDYFTAQDLRKMMPVVLKKRKLFKKYLTKDITLREAFDRASISEVEKLIKKARELVSDVSKSQVIALEQSRFNAFRSEVRRLSQGLTRIRKIVDQRKA